MSATSPPGCCVLKVGGSLLDLEDLGERLQRWMRQRPGQPLLLVCGGGRMVDAVRAWSDIYRLSDNVAHDIAMRSLDASAMLLQSLIPGAHLCASPEEAARAWEAGRPAVALLDAWFRRDHAPAIPKSWDVTSDSLAAWIARELHAHELVLAKSIPAPLCVGGLSSEGEACVDAEFASAAQTIPRVTWLNLRSAPPEESELHSPGDLQYSRS